MHDVLSEQEKQFAADVQRVKREFVQLSTSSIDLEMMRDRYENLNRVRGEIAEERERLRVELLSEPRVTLIQQAEVPQ